MEFLRHLLLADPFCFAETLDIFADHFHPSLCRRKYIPSIKTDRHESKQRKATIRLKCPEMPCISALRSNTSARSCRTAGKGIYGVFFTGKEARLW